MYLYEHEIMLCQVMRLELISKQRSEDEIVAIKPKRKNQIGQNNRWSVKQVSTVHECLTIHTVLCGILSFPILKYFSYIFLSHG